MLLPLHWERQEIWGWSLGRALEGRRAIKPTIQNSLISDLILISISVVVLEDLLNLQVDKQINAAYIIMKRDVKSYHSQKRRKEGWKGAEPKDGSTWRLGNLCLNGWPECGAGMEPGMLYQGKGDMGECLLSMKKVLVQSLWTPVLCFGQQAFRKTIFCQRVQKAAATPESIVLSCIFWVYKAVLYMIKNWQVWRHNIACHIWASWKPDHLCLVCLQSSVQEPT